ncbi:MAG TPA: CHAT domain-containing protein [Methylomirabilota bacterium]|jgi:tetratricopeptide (TPR) repeat protein/CHAT domain-containing protein
MSEESARDFPERLRQIVEEAATVGAGPRRTELLTEGLLNFGRDLLVLVAAERRRDEARFDPVHAEMHALCRTWLMGDALGRGADEDARRARFALWFCGRHPALARVAARIVFKLPEGHPDRDVTAVRDLLVRQLQLAVEGRIAISSALDAIAGVLQLDLVDDERAQALIAAGERIQRRRELLGENDNFRVLAVPVLHQLARRAEDRGDTESADRLRADADRLVATLDRVTEPGRDMILLKSMTGPGGDEARQAERGRLLAGRDDIGLYASRLEATARYGQGRYREVIEVLTPLVPTLEERYLTALENKAIEDHGRELSESLTCLALSHAQLDQWDEALRLLDRAKSLRMRYETVLRQQPGTDRILELQASVMGLERGIAPRVVVEVDPARDPVGARLSVQSRLIEAYRQQRAALGSGGLDGARVRDMAAALDPDQAALVLGESGAGLLIALVAADDVSAPWAASVLPRGARQRLVSVATHPEGWLVALADPPLVADPRAALERLLGVVDEIIGQPVAARLRERDVRRLVVIAHGVLHLVPFWALPSFGQLDVTMVPSAAHMVAFGSSPARLRGRAVVVGDPTLDLPSADVESVVVADTLRAAGFQVDLLRGLEVTEEALDRAVPGAAVLHFAGHGRSDPLRPLESALEVSPRPGDDAEAGDPLLALRDRVHFGEWKDNERVAEVSGHGRLRERRFPVTGRTEIRFEHGARGTLLGQYESAGEGRSDALERSRLSELWSAGDLITRRTLVECGLAVLSSCEAAQGGLSASLDEHAGLPAALQLAGVRALVCPLWEVDDVASAVFAQLFYESLLAGSGEIELDRLVSSLRRRLGGLSAAEAGARVRTLAARAARASTRFRLQAEARRIESAGTPPFADALHWAAFELIGARRVTVGDGAADHAADRPARPPGRTDATVRPIVAVGPDPAPAEAPAREHVADTWTRLATATTDPEVTGEALRHLYERAGQRLKRREFEAARHDLERMLALRADSAEASAGLGALAFAQGDLDGALAALDRAIALTPMLVEAHRDRSLVLVARMDPAGAVAACSAALALAPDDHRLYVQRGMAWLAGSDFSSALRDFDTAIRRWPEEPAAYLAKATVLLARQDSQGALDLCEAGIARQPENGGAYLQRANAHAVRADLDGALADCDTAILLLEAPSAGHAQKGLFLAAAGLLDEALGEYQRAIDADPAFVPVYFSRACALSLAETEGTIVADLERALAAVPQYRQLAAIAPELDWARQHVPAVRRLLGADD